MTWIFFFAFFLLSLSNCLSDSLHPTSKSVGPSPAIQSQKYLTVFFLNSSFFLREGSRDRFPGQTTIRRSGPAVVMQNSHVRKVLGPFLVPQEQRPIGKGGAGGHLGGRIRRCILGFFC
ncbi:hypothetical protein B9Z19DRAFT_1096068 [Tuber borchii]|uniref:Secreted protein n=1 Tax=Tuber borchii TaxID=42251 RepID=A0A2T6ZBY0_TUBBO|nr:hypothetical protein B9Z19DRAFT_1096068 [Tuber borchii]